VPLGLDRRGSRRCLLFVSRSASSAILEILSLLGMIARNGVILIDQIEAERAEGVASGTR
jgi:multidrug efflux pump subunit AcrB